jgi:ATP-dependent DNA ligase
MGTGRLWSRNGWDWSRQFTAITEAVRSLPAREVVIDGEACAHCPEGLPDFHRLLEARKEAPTPACSLLTFSGTTAKISAGCRWRSAGRACRQH